MKVISRHYCGIWFDQFIPKDYSYVWNGNIYVPQIYYSRSIVIKNALIQHEKEHLKTIEKIGYFKFYSSYLLSRKFRKEEELKAYKVQIKYIKSSHIKINIDNWAYIMSNYGLMKWINYDEAFDYVTKWIKE